MDEIVAYYKKMGAPADQTVLVQLLKELQQQGILRGDMLSQLSEQLGVKESFLLAVIRRIPGLRLEDTHTLELCAGPNCGKATALARYAEKHCKDRCQLKFVPCMRLCGKGPNVKFDGKLYHGADENLLDRLINGEKNRG